MPKGPWPSLARPYTDLYESGGIDAHADKILMLYGDEYYNPNTSEAGVVEVAVAKNRDGETGAVKLAWQGE